MTRRWQRLITLLLAGIFLAPGWFPLSVLGVEGTEMTRADHGCACGKLTGCCCELFAPKNDAVRAGEACQLRSRRGSKAAPPAAGHDHHADHPRQDHHRQIPDPHGDHSQTRVTDDGGAASPAGRFCSLPSTPREAPAERAATLDFRTLVGPLLDTTPGLALSPSGFLSGAPTASPDLLPEPPETPPPQPSSDPA